MFCLEPTSKSMIKQSCVLVGRCFHKTPTIWLIMHSPPLLLLPAGNLVLPWQTHLPTILQTPLTPAEGIQQPNVSESFQSFSVRVSQTGRMKQMEPATESAKGYDEWETGTRRDGRQTTFSSEKAEEKAVWAVLNAPLGLVLPTFKEEGGLT